jgi:hypothetical protein
MKKYILITLIVVVGGMLLIYPFLDEEDLGLKNLRELRTPAFTFTLNLSAVLGERTPLEIRLIKRYRNLIYIITIV